MKTVIRISGQIYGNSTLKLSIQTIDSEETKGMFSGFYIFFKTKKEAVKAMRIAYKNLKFEEPEFEDIELYNNILTYDASRATLLPYDDGIELFEIFKITF